MFSASSHSLLSSRFPFSLSNPSHSSQKTPQTKAAEKKMNGKSEKTAKSSNNAKMRKLERELISIVPGAFFLH